MSFSRTSARLNLESLCDRLCLSVNPSANFSSLVAPTSTPQGTFTLTFQGQSTGLKQDGNVVFVGGWGASSYQYAFNDPNGDSAPDALAADESTTDSTIAIGGYIRVKKLNSGG